MTDHKRPDNANETSAMDSRPSTKRGKAQAALGREIQGKIGRQLRAYYDRLIEPTPQRFIEILRQLDQRGDRDPAE